MLCLSRVSDETFSYMLTTMYFYYDETDIDLIVPCANYIYNFKYKYYPMFLLCLLKQCCPYTSYFGQNIQQQIQSFICNANFHATPYDLASKTILELCKMPTTTNNTFATPLIKQAVLCGITFSKNDFYTMYNFTSKIYFQRKSILSSIAMGIRDRFTLDELLSIQDSISLSAFNKLLERNNLKQSYGNYRRELAEYQKCNRQNRHSGFCTTFLAGYGFVYLIKELLKNSN